MDIFSPYLKIWNLCYYTQWYFRPIFPNLRVRTPPPPKCCTPTRKDHEINNGVFSVWKTLGTTACLLLTLWQQFVEDHVLVKHDSICSWKGANPCSQVQSFHGKPSKKNGGCYSSKLWAIDWEWDIQHMGTIIKIYCINKGLNMLSPHVSYYPISIIYRHLFGCECSQAWMCAHPAELITLPVLSLSLSEIL